MTGSNRDNVRQAAEDSKRAAMLAYATSAAALRVLYELHAFFKFLAAAALATFSLGPTYGTPWAYPLWAAAAIVSAMAIADVSRAVKIKIQ